MLWAGDVAPIGTTIVSKEYRLELLESCNLTLSNTKSGKVIRHTNTTHILHDCFVSVEGSGEFTIKYLGGSTPWSNRAPGPKYSDYVLALRPNGNLVVYGPSISASAYISNVGDGEKGMAMVSEE